MEKDQILKSIYVYPVKSLGGISLENALVKERGLEYDRRWMLVDKNGKFITQRENPLMADLKCSIADNSLLFTSNTNKALVHRLSFEEKGEQQPVHVEVWSSKLKAVHIGKIHDVFFSEALQQSCRLVFMDSESKRNANSLITGKKTSVSFADAYPYLILSQASLDDLNTRLTQPVQMERFRPNLVIEGVGPYEEDSLKDIRIGNIRFRLVKPCPRCVIVTIDPDTYEKGKEPLATLASYRAIGNKVMFGVNAIALDYGKINLNDPIEILN